MDGFVGTVSLVFSMPGIGVRMVTAIREEPDWIVWIVLQMAILTMQMWCCTSWLGSMAELLKFALVIPTMSLLRQAALKSGWKRPSFAWVVQFSNPGQVWVWIPCTQLLVELLCKWLWWQDFHIEWWLVQLFVLIWMYEWYLFANYDELQGTPWDVVHIVTLIAQKRLSLDKDKQPSLDKFEDIKRMLQQGDELVQQADKEKLRKLSELKRDISACLEDWKVSEYRKLFNLLRYIHAEKRQRTTTWYNLLKKRHEWLPPCTMNPRKKSPGRPPQPESEEESGSDNDATSNQADSDSDS